MPPAITLIAGDRLGPVEPTARRAGAGRTAKSVAPFPLLTVVSLLLLLALSLTAAPVRAQEGPDAAVVGAAPAGESSAGGDFVSRLVRPVEDVLQQVRQVTASAQSVADFVYQIGETDWQEVIWTMFTRIVSRLCQVVVDALRQAIDQLLDSPFNFITQTPAPLSYESQSIRGLWQTTRNVANAAILLVAIWGGVNVMVQRQLGTPYDDALEFLPRLVVGALLANTSLAWSSIAIELNNALCGLVRESMLPGWRSLADVGQAADLALAGVYLAVVLLLVLQMLLRLALVDLLIVVAPLAMLLWVLPQTQGWSRQWSGAFGGAVFTQFVQVIALKLGGSLLAELAVGSGDARGMNLLVGTAMLCLTFKVPGLMHVSLGDGLGLVRLLALRAGQRLIFGGR